MDDRVLATLLPAETSVVIATPAMYRAALLPEEEAQVAQAVPKRREHFTAGRNAGRAALRQLGLAPSAILSDPRGAPLWPDGVVGSITHCEGFCCAVVARQTSVRSIGIDAEV